MVVLERDHDTISKGIQPYLQKYNVTADFLKVSPNDTTPDILVLLSHQLLASKSVLVLPGNAVVDPATVATLARGHCARHATVSMLLATNPDSVVPAPGTAVASYVWSAATADRTVVSLDAGSGRVLYYVPSINISEAYGERITVKRSLLTRRDGGNGALTLRSGYEDMGIYILSRSALRFLVAKAGTWKSLSGGFIKHLVQAQFNEKALSEFAALRMDSGGSGGNNRSGGGGGGNASSSPATTAVSSPTRNSSATAATAVSGAVGSGGSIPGGNDTAAAAAAAAAVNARARLLASNAADHTLESEIDMFEIPSPYTFTHAENAEPVALMCYAMVVPENTGALCARVSNISRYYELNKTVAKGAAPFLPWEPLVKDKFVAPSAKVDTVVSPESVVGEGSVIKERSSCRKTIVGRNCTIGSYAKITNSLIMDGVTIGDGVQISDSIVCSGVSVTLQEGLSKADAGSGITGSIIGHGNQLVLTGPIKNSVRMLNDEEEEDYEEVEEEVEEDEEEMVEEDEEGEEGEEEEAEVEGAEE